MKMPRELEPLAYIAGVVVGDGWCSDLSFGLGANDLDFVQAFVSAVKSHYSAVLRIRQANNKHWIARASNKSGRFNSSLRFEPKTAQERSVWLRAFFDSDGNACYGKSKKSENAAYCKVAIFKSDETLLQKAQKYLASLNILSSIRPRKLTVGHFGKKPMFELSITRNDNMARFAQLVGSSIQRKQLVLDKIVAHHAKSSINFAAAQAKGAAAKRERTLNAILPSVLTEIKRRIDNADSFTTRECFHIDGYHAVHHIYTHSELVDMAKGLP